MSQDCGAGGIGSALLLVVTVYVHCIRGGVTMVQVAELQHIFTV